MPSRTADLPSALESLDQIRRKAGERQWAVFLDYDGTLTPIVERPELAVLSEQTRNTLQRLAQKLTVGVISGRDLRDVRRLVGIEGIYYSGSHGFEIEGPGGWHLELPEAAAFLPALDRSEEQLRRSLGSVEGAIVERKRFSIAAHYRLVDSAEHHQVEEAVAAAASKESGLRQAGGKMVYELQPRLDWHKGKALLRLLDSLQLQRDKTMPVFIGDDLTDEDAFRAIEGNGAGIVVKDGNRETFAGYALDDTGQVRQLLNDIEHTL